jgi:hypothetical protein
LVSRGQSPVYILSEDNFSLQLFQKRFPNHGNIPERLQRKRSSYPYAAAKISSDSESDLFQFGISSYAAAFSECIPKVIFFNLESPYTPQLFRSNYSKLARRFWNATIR